MISAMPVNALLLDTLSPDPRAWRSLLEEAGYSVLVADSAPQAVAVLQAHDVALALLAAPGEGADANVLARHIRDAEGGSQVPIVVLADAPEAQVGALWEGTTLLAEVFSPQTDTRVLLGKLRVWLDLHRQRRELAGRAAELERVSRLNSLMIGALLHDMRTPMAVITLNAELVIRRAEVPAVQQAGVRIKGAAAMLIQQSEHLVNLAATPTDDLRPVLVSTDLGLVAQQRIDAAAQQALLGVPVSLQVEGDVLADVDPGLIAQAIDHLLLLAAMHGTEQPMRVEVQGGFRRSLVLRVATDAVVSGTARQHLFAGGEAEPGLPTPRVGPGLQLAERIARAHGGSLIGRSRETEGTLFEMMLPRDQD